MKVACLQFAPEVGNLHGNIARANAILDEAVSQGRTAELDWLLLPELALTGYNFPSLDAIGPFLEPTAAGTSTRWAADVAQRLRCYVTVGYPEAAADGKRYNSAVTLSPTGDVLLNYRKTFLYYTDETWAHEGDRGFFSGPLGALGPVSMGICMDINPHKFLAPFDAYEFATSCLLAESPIVAINMAWLTRQTAEEIAAQPDNPDAETLAYWLERFFPLLDVKRRPQDAPPVILIMANRCGTEGAVAYAGTSTVMKIESGRTQIFDILGKGEEKLLVVNLNEPPKFAVTTSSQAPSNP